MIPADHLDLLQLLPPSPPGRPVAVIWTGEYSGKLLSGWFREGEAATNDEGRYRRDEAGRWERVA